MIVGSIWQHNKTGALYQIVSCAKMETTMDDVIIYRGLNNGLDWVRPSAEFFDGRFKQVQVVAAPEDTSE